MTRANLQINFLRDLLNNGTREQILEWLAWNDANGCYTDADCYAEDLPTLDESDAKMMLAAVMEDM